MEMALKMNSATFAPLTFDELMTIDGGGAVGDVTPTPTVTSANLTYVLADTLGAVGDALKATAGAVLVAWSPVIAIGVSMVATPAGGVCAGMSAFGLGLTLIGSATH